MKQEQSEQVLLLNPLYLFSEEVKNKSLKKQSIQSVFTIAIAMTSQQIVSQLLPFFTKIIVEENNQIRIIAIQAINSIFQLAETQQQKWRFLEWTIDILCVFQEQDIRKPAYQLLNIVLMTLQRQSIKQILTQAIKQLIESPQKNIRQVTLELVYFYYQSQELLSKDDQNQLFELLNKYKNSIQDKIVLAKGLSKIVSLIPAIEANTIISLITQLLQSNQPKIKSKLVQPIIMLAQKTSQDQALPLLTNLIRSQDNSIKCELVLKIEKITTLFKSQNIQQINEMFKNFVNQNHDVKNSILKVFQHASVNQSFMQQVKKPLNSVQLKNTLVQSLCRINDEQTLKHITSSIDNDFKSKIYPKLPPLSQLHVQIVDSLLQQKNFRSKLTIIQSVQRRVDEGENGQILLDVLLKYLGDRTAVVRIGIQKLICKIVRKNNKMSQKLISKLKQSLQQQNWFQRQAGYLLLKDIVQNNQNQQVKKVIKQLLSQRQQDQTVSNIITTINQIKQELNQSQKLQKLQK